MSEPHRVMQLLPLLTVLLITSPIGSGLAACNGQGEEGALNSTDPTSTASPTYEPLITSIDTTAAHAPKSITRNVLQDKSGRFWFATWEGIISYDGKQFTNVTVNEDLEKFRVFSLLEDRAGILWFGTITGGVYRYDGSSFVRYTTADGLADNSVLCMLEDDAGNIWFGTDSGASRYDGKTFTHFAIQDGPGINVNSIAQDGTGTLWFGTRYGVESDLYSYDGRSFAPVERAPGTRFWNVRSVIVDGSGILWTGGQDGLVRGDPSGSRPDTSGLRPTPSELLRTVAGSFTQVSTHFIGYIFEDRAGNLWLSEDQGGGWALKRSDGNSATIIATSSMVFGSTEDASGNIWFGNIDGVGRYDGKIVTRFRD